MLVVDDDHSVVETLDQQLSKHGVRVSRAVNLQSAMYHFNQQKFEVAIVEREFEELAGILICQRFRSHDDVDRSSIGLILSCSQERNSEDQALISELGGIETVMKPLAAIKLLGHLTRAAEQRRLRTELLKVRVAAFETFKNNGDLARALSVIEQGLPGKSAPKLELIADLLSAAEKNDDALKLVEDLIKSEPKNIRLLNIQSQVLIGLGRLEDAGKILEKADQAAPGNVARTEALSKLYLDLDRPSDAVAKMRKLLTFNPDVEGLQFNFFDQLKAKGYEEHGLKLVNDTSSPKEVVRHYNNKGVVLSKQSKSDEALKEYYTALMFFPNHKDKLQDPF